MAGKSKQLKITQVKSGIGYSQRMKDTLRALGIHRMHHTVIKPDNPAIRGMIARVRHLVRIEDA